MLFLVIAFQFFEGQNIAFLPAYTTSMWAVQKSQLIRDYLTDSSNPTHQFQGFRVLNSCGRELKSSQNHVARSEKNAWKISQSPYARKMRYGMPRMKCACMYILTTQLLNHITTKTNLTPFTKRGWCILTRLPVFLLPLHVHPICLVRVMINGHW